MPATAVTKASSILSLPPDVEERFPADGDHSTLVKLGSPHNDTYTTVVCVLDELLEELESKAA